MAKKLFSGMFDKMVKAMTPQVEDTIKMSVKGLVVKTNTPDGKQWVTADGTIVDEDFLIEFPVMTVAKQPNQVKVGDIVKITSSTYGVVESITKGKVETRTFGGEHREAKAFKDMFFGQAAVRVVVNLANNFGGADQAGMTNMLPFLAFANKDGEGSTSDLMEAMMMSSMFANGGANPFANMFGGLFGAPAAPVAPATPAEAPAAE